MKIAVYAICKNEEANVARFYQSAQEADVVCVLDTGSTDGTVALLQYCQKVQIATALFSPWRFDDALNASLALVPGDVDLCVRLDLDETLEVGWREKLEAAFDPAATIYWHPYHWSQPDGNIPGTQFPRNYIHQRQGYRWQGITHEVLLWTGEGNQHAANVDIICDHWGAAKNRTRDLPLLRQSMTEYPDDPRWQYYYGRECYYQRRYDEAITHLTGYLMREDNFWSQRADAMRWLARCQPERATYWLYRAVAEDAGRRDTWVDLAQACYDRQMWADGYAAAEHAVIITETASYITEGRYWGALPFDLSAICAWQLGLHDIARQRLMVALQYSPADDRLLKNAVIMGI